jgi:hypothetical protein
MLAHAGSSSTRAGRDDLMPIRGVLFDVDDTLFDYSTSDEVGVLAHLRAHAIGSLVRGGTGSTPAAGGFGVADGVVEGAALGEADVVAEGGAGGLAADRESRVR